MIKEKEGEPRKSILQTTYRKCMSKWNKGYNKVMPSIKKGRYAKKKEIFLIRWVGNGTFEKWNIFLRVFKKRIAKLKKRNPQNAYKLKFPENLDISVIFNVVDLYEFKRRKLLGSYQSNMLKKWNKSSPWELVRRPPEGNIWNISKQELTHLWFSSTSKEIIAWARSSYFLVSDGGPSFGLSN